MRTVKWLVLVVLVAFAGWRALDALVGSTRVQLFGQMIRRLETRDKVVALTFDDGPNPPNTTALLDALERNQVRATFFLIGANVEKYPEAARAILARGHELGNHTYTHTYRYFERPAVIRAEIERTDALLRGLGATGEINFRAPYGRKFLVLPHVLSTMGKRNVLWDVNSHDYENPAPAVLVRGITEQVRPGSVVLLHDCPQTTAALDAIIGALKEQGYTFKTVAELVQQKGLE